MHLKMTWSDFNELNCMSDHLTHCSSLFRSIWSCSRPAEPYTTVSSADRQSYPIGKVIYILEEKGRPHHSFQGNSGGARCTLWRGPTDKYWLGGIPQELLNPGTKLVVCPKMFQSVDKSLMVYFLKDFAKIQESSVNLFLFNRLGRQVIPLKIPKYPLPFLLHMKMRSPNWRFVCLFRLLGTYFQQQRYLLSGVLRYFLRCVGYGVSLLCSQCIHCIILQVHITTAWCNNVHDTSTTLERRWMLGWSHFQE